MAQSLPASDVAEAVLNLIEDEYIVAAGEECLIENAELDGPTVAFIVNDGDRKQHRFILSVVAIEVPAY